MYIGMVHAMASWRIEIAWQGQREWRKEMTLLQKAVAQKTLVVLKGRSRRKVNPIVAVEKGEMWAKPASGGFLACTLCDPT